MGDQSTQYQPMYVSFKPLECLVAEVNPLKPNLMSAWPQELIAAIFEPEPGVLESCGLSAQESLLTISLGCKVLVATDTEFSSVQLSLQKE